jgi:toxin ParE1/3/4
MSIVIHVEASQEARAAVEWYEERRTGLGAAFLDELDRAFRVIANSPETWPFWPDIAPKKKIRRFLLARFPFGVAYRETKDSVLIVAVAHLNRHPDYWKKRRFDKQ